MSQEATNAAESSPTPGRVAVTAGDTPVTLREHGDLLPPLCPDPERCRHYMRFPNGPWACRCCHPRVGERPRAALGNTQRLAEVQR